MGEGQAGKGEGAGWMEEGREEAALNLAAVGTGTWRHGVEVK